MNLTIMVVHLVSESQFAFFSPVFKLGNISIAYC